MTAKIQSYEANENLPNIGLLGQFYEFHQKASAAFLSKLKQYKIIELVKKSAIGIKLLFQIA